MEMIEGHRGDYNLSHFMVGAQRGDCNQIRFAEQANATSWARIVNINRLSATSAPSLINEEAHGYKVLQNTALHRLGWEFHHSPTPLKAV